MGWISITVGGSLTPDRTEKTFSADVAEDATAEEHAKAFDDAAAFIAAAKTADADAALGEAAPGGAPPVPSDDTVAGST